MSVVKIVVNDYINRTTLGELSICESGYRLHLTVEGPADIDPISGNKIRPTIVN